jgi:glutamine synthetase
MGRPPSCADHPDLPWLTDAVSAGGHHHDNQSAQQERGHHRDRFGLAPHAREPHPRALRQLMADTLPLATPAEAEAFLAAHPDVAFIDIIFTGLAGTARGKRIRRHELAGVYQGGRPLPVSILVADVTGQDCFDTGLVWENGDADRFARPAPGRLVATGPTTAAVITSLHEPDGQLCELDCRAVLNRVAARFADLALQPVVACELEFYLCDRERADGQPPRPARLGGARPSTHGTYGLEELDDAGPFLADLWQAADAAGLPLETAISEYAAGQMELTLKHRADPVGVADDVVLYKRLVKQVARRHGMLASFMAKPFADSAGNGMHLHVSVNDAAGVNIFAGTDVNPALRHAIGGLKALLAESFAIFAPNANSYRRFRAGSFAPVAASWGVDNRTTSFRVTAGSPASRHIEHRIAGADANPYLALAALLAGVHHGLTQQIDPGPPVTGDGYAAAAKADPAAARLPGDWFSAVAALERAQTLPAYLGAHTLAMFASVKRTEQERYMAVVPPLDHDWYLANA